MLQLNYFRWNNFLYWWNVSVVTLIRFHVILGLTYINYVYLHFIKMIQLINYQLQTNTSNNWCRLENLISSTYRLSLMYVLLLCSKGTTLIDSSFACCILMPLHKRHDGKNMLIFQMYKQGLLCRLIYVFIGKKTLFVLKTNQPT